MTSISLPPEHWGSSLWKTMYCIAYTYPDSPSNDEKVAALHFYSSLAHLIPCETCRTHYKKLIAVKPVNPHCENRTKLLKWLEMVSNDVNTRLKKDPFDAEAYYKELDSMKIVPPAPRSAADVTYVYRKGKAPVAVPRKRPCNCGKRVVKKGVATTRATKTIKIAQKKK